jgi:hypothetical protein
MSKSNDDLVDEWHKLPESDSRTIWEYMGMTKEEYASYVEHPEIHYWSFGCGAKADGECADSKCPMGIKFFGGKGDARDCPLKEDPYSGDNPCGF